MKLLIKVYDELAQDPPICSPDYFKCLFEVMETTGGTTDSAVFSDLIAKGRFSLENIFQVLSTLEDHDYYKVIFSQWSGVWCKTNPELLKKALPAAMKSPGQIQALLFTAIMHQDEKMLLFLAVLLLFHVKKNDYEFDFSSIEGMITKKMVVSLRPPERNLLFFLQKRKVNDAFIGIWIHSDRPFKTLPTINTRIAFELIGSLRKIYPMPLPPPEGDVNPPKEDSERHTFVSGNGQFILGIATPNHPRHFWTHEHAPDFFFLQCFDHLLTYGPVLIIAPASGGSIKSKRRLSDSSSSQRIEELIKIGSERMLTEAESLELESNHPLAMTQISWYVPPELWSHFNDNDKKNWAQRTVESGYIPPDKLKDLLDSLPSRCKVQYDYHSQTRAWHFWNREDQGNSYLRCFKCQAPKRRKVR